ncbi:ATP-binding protein [Ekhidna sp.]
MSKIPSKDHVLDARRIMRAILLAFLLGVSAVLVSSFIANRFVKEQALVRTELDNILGDCNKQRLLSQFLSKNVFLLDNTKSIKDQNLVKLRLDTALELFHKTHYEIEAANLRLKNLGLQIKTIDSLYAQLEPSLSALIKSSYGIQEEGNFNTFRLSIIKHDELFLPLTSELINEYQSIANVINERLNTRIQFQYWLIGGTVILAATLVFLFTFQLVSSKIKSYKDAFEPIEEAKKTYENLLESTQEIIYELDAKGRYTYLNQALEDLLGYSLSELKGKKWYDYVPPRHKKNILLFLDEKIQNKEKSAYYEFPILGKQGTEIWIGHSIDFTYDKVGEVIKIYNIGRDIRNERENSLKEEKYKNGLRLLNELNSRPNEELAKKLSDGLQLCLDFLGLETGVVSHIWMDQYQVIASYPQRKKEEYSKKFKLADTYCDITLAQKEKLFNESNMSQSMFKDYPSYKRQKIESYIGAAYRVDGKVFGTINFSSVSARRTKFSQYEIDFISLVSKWVGNLVEIEETKSRTKEEQHLLKTFVSNAPAAIAMFDKHMIYISASKRWYEDQNLQEDIIGKSHYKVFPEIKNEWKEMHKRALQGEIIKPGIEKFERTDGSIQWLQGEIHPWYTSKEKIGGIIIFSNDITDIKRQEVELRTAKEEAEKAGNIKEQFLSTMSHEIRTPLNAIIGTTHLLELEHPELANNSRLKMLKFGSNNLLTLINDILDFQKIESGNLEIIEEDVNVHELVDNIIEIWKAVPRNEQVSLKKSYSNKLRDYYVCDGVRLTQVLNNLISNAVKFTEEGEVELDICLSENGFVQFTVKDTGIGIPSDKIDLIFESFKQINSQQILKTGGTGLGLSISKRLVELMGGQLQVTSKVGTGTSFYFTIPLGLSQAKATKKSIENTANQAIDLTILLVEDNQANQEIAKGFLSRWGIKVDVANNGEEAVKKITSMNYDLVLMDVRMPVMDGYEATKCIRSMDDSYFKKVPIIALTASTLVESRIRMESCGMTEIVSKPFDPNELFEKVNRLGNVNLQKLNQHVSKEPNSTIDLTKFTFLNEVLAGDIEQIMTVLKMTVESLENNLLELNELFDSKDRDKAHDTLHKMKSSLANVDLKDLAAQIPNYKADNFWKELNPFLKLVDIELKKVKSFL